MRFLSILALSLFSSTLFAQVCEVAMVDRYDRTIRIFRAYDDPRVCQEGMKECRKMIRMEPQYGGVDCIRLGDNHPSPNPRPVPVPNPRPTPDPYPTPNPYPNPQPYPYEQVDAKSLLLDMSYNISSSQSATKVLERAIQELNISQLIPLVRICSSTRSWSENMQCLLDGINRAPMVIVQEGSAIQAVGQACTLPSNWSEEQSCFANSLRHLPSLGYLGASCANMGSSESSSRCFRSVFQVP